MPENRFFLDKNFFIGNEYSLSSEESRHLYLVMRGKVGDSIEVVNGKGFLALSRLIHTDKDECRIQIEALREESKPYKIYLFQALPKFDRLEIILEKGCELGIDGFYLFPGDFSQGKEISRERKERMQRILIAAMKQCGRLDLPFVEYLSPIKSWKKENLFFPAFFGDLGEEAPPLLSFLKKEPKTSFIVGPEGGFSENERKSLIELGIKGVKINSNTLRCETAAICFAAILSHVM